jgi:hypothetical protein
MSNSYGADKRLAERRQGDRRAIKMALAVHLERRSNDRRTGDRREILRHQA